jgi:hypothetical protein
LGRLPLAFSYGVISLRRPVGQANVFRDAVLTFEIGQDWGARDLMTICGVIATESELACAGLTQAFPGYFDQRFRDYDVRRTHAWQVLTVPALNEPGALGRFDTPAATFNLSIRGSMV